MTAAALLDRLESVKPTGPDRWIARCPAHDDRSPSLSIRETSDGTILIHCFGGCSPVDIMQSVGLELKDLYPSNYSYHRQGKKPSYNARDLLELVRHEMTVLLLWVGKIDPGKPLDTQDQAIVERAKDSLVRALGVINA